jgi:hypothetical protein
MRVHPDFICAIPSPNMLIPQKYNPTFNATASPRFNYALERNTSASMFAASCSAR